jgi:metallo-beta-lactamase family protein
MNLGFYGAAKTVTGSNHMIEAAGKKILIDCGMFQGHDRQEEINFEAFPFNVSEIDAIILTHAHIDHSGRVPKMVKEGFTGPIVCTKATADLCGIMLPDSGYIQETEAEWKSRKRSRAGKAPVEPLYTYEDAVASLEYLTPYKYDVKIDLFEGVTVRFRDAGHILGSAFVEIWVKEGEEETKVVFSGDIGNKNLPILKDPNFIEDADYLVMESTYGNREHKPNENKVEKLLSAIKRTIKRGGNVIIPSFAVGRTQEIIYELHKYKEKYKEDLEFLSRVPVYVDSPLAISATEIFRQNLDCYDEEARMYVSNGDNPLDFPGLKFTRTADESRELNEKDEPMIIISASGMCEAGRIKHHLKHNLWKKNSTVLFVGYQAEGTLGRRIIEGVKKVKILGEDISVNAEIESIEGYSGHAGQSGLVEFVERFETKPKKIFIVHGETDAQKSLSKLIREKFNIDTVIPERGDLYELVAGEVSFTTGQPELKKRFARLELLSKLDVLQEELAYLSAHADKEFINEKTDQEVADLQKKFENLEKMMDSVKAVID